jgi:hypothetical protein
MGKRLALLLVLAAFVAAEPASAAYPGSNGRIAFQRTDGYIYSIASDGAGLKRLGLGTSPSYSPDGSRIAFELNGDIWTMNSDGTHRQQVTTSSAQDADPTWSPDGTRIVFSSNRSPEGIYSLSSTIPYGKAVLVEAAPSDAQNGIESFDAYPAWATNGLIYYTRFTHYGGSFCDDSQDTWRVNPATHATHFVIRNAIEAAPGPAAGALAYINAYKDPNTCDYLTGVSIAGIGGANAHTVTAPRSTTPSDGFVVFSPTGTLLAFQRGNYVMIIRPNGTGLRRLTLGQNPSWQPAP